MVSRLIYKLVFRTAPKLRLSFYIYFNRIIFLLQGVKFGKNMRVFDRFYLSMQEGASLIIGNNFTFSSGDGINPLSRNIRGKIFIDKGASIKIGDNSGISSACLWSKEKITIGNNVKIGGDCVLMDTDAHNLDWMIRAGLKKDKFGGGG